VGKRVANPWQDGERQEKNLGGCIPSLLSRATLVIRKGKNRGGCVTSGPGDLWRNSVAGTENKDDERAIL